MALMFGGKLTPYERLGYAGISYHCHFPKQPTLLQMPGFWTLRIPLVICVWTPSEVMRMLTFDTWWAVADPAMFRG